MYILLLRKRRMRWRIALRMSSISSSSELVSFSMSVVHSVLFLIVYLNN